MRYFFILIISLFIYSCNTYEGVDITKPSAYISFPQNGDLASDSLTVQAIGSDDIGIDFIELWINQENTGIKDFNPPYEFIVDTHSLIDIEEGEGIELSVKAFDTSENESALSTTVEVFLDNQPPTKVILNPIIEENGVLTFSWSKSTDLDFYAYVVTENGAFFNFIDTITSVNIIEVQFSDYYNSASVFGIQVIDNGGKTTNSNNVKPISFKFENINGGNFDFGENNIPVNIVDPFKIMVSEVSNLQYSSYLSVAREINVIDTTNIGPWVLDNDGNILYDLENGAIKWNGENFYIDGILDNYLIPSNPVTYVSWHGAVHFAEFFNFKLPNEYQWEKAAAGDGEYDYPWGNEIISSYANYFENEDMNELIEPYEPGLAPVSADDQLNIDTFWFFDTCPEECNGLNHMAGNVWEWVTHENGYSDSQMCRGGSWRSSKQNLRVWSTKYLESHSTGDHVGFRCIK